MTDKRYVAFDNISNNEFPMLGRRTKYGRLLSKIENFKAQLEEAFAKRANQEGLLGNHNITNVLKDWGEILSFNTDEAKYWFREGNSKLPEDLEFQ